MQEESEKLQNEQKSAAGYSTCVRNFMTIKVCQVCEMAYTKLEEPEKTEHISVSSSNCVAYVEILGSLFMTAMVCGTLLVTTRMWVIERELEMTFLRGANP